MFFLIFFIGDLEFIRMIDFDGFDLIFGFKMCKIVESVKLEVHTPDINFVG
jgi:hypothetical protein